MFLTVSTRKPPGTLEMDDQGEVQDVTLALSQEQVRLFQ